MSKKKCATCFLKFNNDAFYRFKRKNKDVYEYMNICKECHKNNVKTHNNKKNIKLKKSIYLKEYKIKHKERIKRYNREYKQTRRKNDKVFLLQERISTQVYITCKKMSLKKDASFWKIIGYAPEDLFKHLERQFWLGMTWNNYGEWHIDHIQPKSSFNIKSFGDDEFMKCWGLSNLQPLWDEDNQLKGDFFEKNF
jgi:hypothetical protein